MRERDRELSRLKLTSMMHCFPAVSKKIALSIKSTAHVNYIRANRIDCYVTRNRTRTVLQYNLNRKKNGHQIHEKSPKIMLSTSG